MSMNNHGDSVTVTVPQQPAAEVDTQCALTTERTIDSGAITVYASSLKLNKSCS
jgi:hypothetical protein